MARGIVLLLLAAAVALASAAKPPPPANFYDAVVKHKLTKLQEVIDGAGMKAYFSNPNLKATMMAPNNAAFDWLFADCKVDKLKEADTPPACSMKQLLCLPKKQLRDILVYLLVEGNIKVQPNKDIWLTNGKFTRWPTLQGDIVRLRQVKKDFEVHGTGRDAKVRFTRNIIVGKGLFNIVDNFITSWPKK
ncbi:phage head morphogenesis isoform A [Micractinium conductrix]|uniref:Phage head morphogenesis isoform A n=1 Tax=Micractinium conductrix TaxID=554055 RepID=A0A2P6V111_9CHLO|nr:phage head morphogenesis isoform A [Micractinium conductrix]|eukprot:PSC67779.1 phage head morphogenesis isoform A [Micractinium conductrix]